MKPVRFDYVRAKSAEDASRLLHDNFDAMPMAGGQTLMPLLNMRLARPTLIVDISHIRELIGVTIDDTNVTVGAATRQLAVETDADIARACPLLAKAMPWIGHRATRSRGTIGGSIAFADPAAELPLVAVALDAQINTAGGGGVQTFAARDFFLGDMMTALPEGALITGIRFPRVRDIVGSGFREVATRHSDFAFASAAAQISVDASNQITDARLAVGAVDGKPQFLGELSRAFVGAPAENDGALAALKDVEDAISARAGPTASDSYGRRAAAELLRGAVTDALGEVNAHD